MSQLSHPSQKKTQHSQENLLQGLQDSKSTMIFPTEERKHEFEGSMLLDSINHLLKEVQKKYSPIKQVDETEVVACEKPIVSVNNEKDDAQTILQQYIIPPQNQFVQPTQLLLQPQNNPQFLQQLHSENYDMDSNFLNPNEIKQPLQLTNYNICSSEQKESQVKRDLNSSLFVEVSDRKDLDFSQFMPMGMDLYQGKSSIYFDESRDNQNEIMLNKNQSLQIICQAEYINEKTTQMQSKRTQLSQIYSLDSSKIIQMIPQEYFQDGIDNIESKIKVIAQKNQQVQLDQYENKNNHFILEKQIQVPMDIEFESKQVQTPMDIESIGIQYNFNNIRQIRNEQMIQPINRENQLQLQGQQRCEQIEIINSIIDKIPEIDENLKSKQFTFGKVDNPINIYENKTSDQDFNLDSSINSINGNNNLIQDNGNSEQIIKNLSFDHSIDKETFHNLSLNVQCDNHQIQGLEDLECLIPQSIKSQSRESNKIQKNEIINHVQKETIYIENSSQSQEVEDIQKKSEILIKSGLKGQNIPLVIQIHDQQRMVEKKTDSSLDILNRQTLNNESLITETIQQNQKPYSNVIQEKNPKQNNSQIEKQDIIPLSSVAPSQQPNSRKVQINQRKLSYQNNLINYSLNPQTKNIAGQSNFYQDRNKPQVIIHNDNYNIPSQNNQNYPNNFTYHQNSGCHHKQTHFNCYPSVPTGYFRPQISINFRNNEMFVNISGPSTPNTIKCEQAPGKVEEKPDISEDEANKKICQSIVSKVAESIIIKEKDNQLNIDSKKDIEKTNKPHQISQSQRDKQSSTLEKSSISPAPPSEQEILIKYDFIIQLSEQYLNNTQPSEEIHKQFQYNISPFTYIRFTPQPKDLFGSKLFKNGIFLIALVKLISRTSSSAFLANYIIQYFQSAFGLGIEKNTYVFRCQAESFKKKYSEELEKKYLERLRADQSKKSELLNSRAQPLKRVVIHNPFLSLKSEKKDESCQMSPRKTETSTNVSIQTENQQLVNPPQKQLEKTELSKRYQTFVSNEKQKIIKNSEEVSENKSQKSRQTSLVKFQNKLSLTQDPFKNQNKSDKDEKSDDNDKSQNKLNLRQSGGLLIKKGFQPESSNKEQVSRFNDLYQKYRRIRENKKTEPIDNSSIKKNIVEQVAKIQNYEQQPPKRSQRKQVMFSQETITKENEKGFADEEGDGDNKKKKKMRKSKPKKDSSVEEQCEDLPIPSKTRKNFGRKDK